MLADEYILIVPFAYQLHHGATFLRNIKEVYSASQFYLSLVTGLDVTRNISTAESPDTLYARLPAIFNIENSMKTFLLLGTILLSFVLFSCDRASNEKILKDGWAKKTLCNHWIIQLPSGTSVKSSGCTNDLKRPGNFSFQSDSLKCQFYAFGPVLNKETDCNFEAILKWAKEKSSNGACQGDGSIKYTTTPYIDYHSKIAGAIGRAIDSSKYLTTLEIGHCTNWSLTLIFEAMSPYYDNMATEIIKSVEFKMPDEPK